MLTFDEAQQVCRRFYCGDLVSIHSNEENDFVNSKLRVNLWASPLQQCSRTYKKTSYPPADTWIGLERFFDIWAWNDKTAVDYENFKKEPYHSSSSYCVYVGLCNVTLV